MTLEVVKAKVEARYWSGSITFLPGLPPVDVDPTGLVVEYGLNEGWDDAGFRVGLSGWVPRGFGVDD